ncbi:MAG: hypothetical protein A2Y33_07550 [Spirochaetes bacterium GWF1_51_8]|nr:MAG: hypothetical protein A2Y33_07550 [Spirochaetes bacterium GWF1_51_8]
MNRVTRYIIFLLLLMTAYGFAKSVWTTMPFYHLNLKPGDILRIKFSEKTLMKYKIEQTKNKNVGQKGVTGKGEMFSFFPDIELKGDDTVKSKNELNINNQSKFTVPAKVESVDGGIVTLKADTSTIVNGQVLGVMMTGECPVKFISPDYSVFSSDIHNMDFEIKNFSQSESEYFNADDLVFSTNYAEFITNYTYLTNIAPLLGWNVATNGRTNFYTNIATNLITNYTFTTNMSSIRLKLEGFTDAKQKDIIIKYVGIMMNSLFK